ncbi:putative transmembrane protein [Toxoplasma gondii MAS]|uniref:Putative transmembrane protein n=2 Tax=Toxoplasma gondii TaxID=5811 RepID=A0A086QR59_TOXGO|nr:putative transmembrane protein [Toxoplasma gondii MAS]PUA88949.1 putative transmembrane protein [Toxoplasma gondii TgCATBr9]
MILKLLYLAFVVIIAALLFLSIPSYVLAKEPQTTEEREFAVTCTRYIVCFVCAWIVSGGIMQLLYLVGSAFNPLDPASTFFVPSQFRLNTWETYVALAIWFGITYAFVQLRKQYEQDARFDPHLISQEVKEQWKRVTSQ